jgi:hypothetical protein
MIGEAPVTVTSDAARAHREDRRRIHGSNAIEESAIPLEAPEREHLQESVPVDVALPERILAQRGDGRGEQHAARLDDRIERLRTVTVRRDVELARGRVEDGHREATVPASQRGSAITEVGPQKIAGWNWRVFRVDAKHLSVQD